MKSIDKTGVMKEEFFNSSPAPASLDIFFTPATLVQANRVPDSAWLEHIPFAFWLVRELQPRMIVELGTHSGASYFAMCQAIKMFALDCKSFAVDTWQGDEQAGFYDEKVFLDVAAHNQENYAAFSTLIRDTFDRATDYFSDGVIDLLHIDGYHSYEAVKHDFENWYSKLSKSAVVIFHDTNVRQNGFGVSRFWEEVSGKYPSFEFYHGHGLGVLLVGERVPASVKELVRTGTSAISFSIREYFSRLGLSYFLSKQHAILLQENDHLRHSVSQLNGDMDRLNRDLESAKSEILATTQRMESMIELSNSERTDVENVLSARMRVLEEELTQQLLENQNKQDQIDAEIQNRTNLEALLIDHRQQIESLQAAAEGLKKLAEESDREVQKASQKALETQRQFEEVLASETNKLLTEMAEISDRYANAALELENLKLLRAQELAAVKKELDSYSDLLDAVESIAQDSESNQSVASDPLSLRDRVLAARLKLMDFKSRTVLPARISIDTGSVEQEYEKQNEVIQRSLLQSYEERLDVMRELYQLKSGFAGRVGSWIRKMEEALPFARSMGKKVWKKIRRQNADDIYVDIYFLGLPEQMRIIRSLNLFDDDWYGAVHADLSLEKSFLLEHFLRRGSLEGRSPHPLFNLTWYRQEYSIPAHQNALLHYISVGYRKGFNPHPLFSSDWYCEKYSISPDKHIPLCHFLEESKKSPLQPNPLFLTEWYRKEYQSELGQKIPIIHYLTENTRSQFDPNPVFSTILYHESYIKNEATTSLDPLSHYLMIGDSAGHTPSTYFDPHFYREKYPDVIGYPNGFMAHYIERGRVEKRMPREWVTSEINEVALALHHFDLNEKSLPDSLTSYYPDVTGLVEFFKGNRLTPLEVPITFDAQTYFAVYTDLAGSERSDFELLVHFILHGRRERRVPRIKSISEYELPLMRGNGKTHEQLLMMQWNIRIAVIVHIFYPQLYNELRNYILNLGKVRYDIYFNLVENSWTPEFHDQIRSDFPLAKIVVSENIGRDIGGFFNILSYIPDVSDYDYYLVLHSKRSPHIGEAASDKWRRDLMNPLVGSNLISLQNLYLLEKSRGKIGFIGSGEWRHQSVDSNTEKYQALLDLLEIDNRNRDCDFVAGTMMWLNGDVLNYLYTKCKKLEFENGNNQPLSFHMDGQIAHSVERVFGNICKQLELTTVFR